MMKFIVLLVSLPIFLMTVSCGSSNKVVSVDFRIGTKYYENYVDYFLRGDNKTAEYNFYKSLDRFQLLDDNCNISRLYISKFVISEEYPDNVSLEKGLYYAKVGGCIEEVNSVYYLTGSQYDLSKLPQSLKIDSELSKNLNLDKLESLIGDNSIKDYTKTRLIRKYVLRISESADRKRILLDKAFVLDKYNGWSLNIFRDLKILSDICNIDSLECIMLKERKSSIENKLMKK